MIINDVLIGKNGWLFHGQGSNRWLEYLQGNLEIENNCLSDWKCHLSLWHEILKKRVKRHAFVVVPEKHTVLRHLLPAGFFPEGIDVGTRFCAAVQTPIVNLAYEMEGIRHSELLYCKTDSHWSAAGAALAYGAICNALEIEALPITFECHEKLRWRGDLGRKLKPARGEWIETITPIHDIVLEFSNSVNNVGYISLKSCPSALIKGTLLLIGNSFCTSHLANLLAQTFEKTIFMFSNSIDDRLIDDFDPQFCVFQTNERFLCVAPNNKTNDSNICRLVAKIMISDVPLLERQSLLRYPSFLHDLVKRLLSEEGDKGALFHTSLSPSAIWAVGLAVERRAEARRLLIELGHDLEEAREDFMLHYAEAHLDQPQRVMRMSTYR